MGTAAVSVGSIAAGVGVSISTVSVYDVTAGTGVLADGNEVGRGVPTGLTSVAGGDGAIGAMPPRDSGVLLALGAFAGIWAALATGPASARGSGLGVGVRISHGVAVASGVRVAQAFRESWVGRIRA